MTPPSQQPRGVASLLEQVAPFPSFARYMERCLHDPSFGYYHTGKVRFGRTRDFLTFPRLLRPLFGWMVAEAARRVFDTLAENGVGNETPLTILELGGGEGELARDVIDYIQDRAETPEWKPYASRTRYVLGEHSPVLRERQSVRLRTATASGLAEVQDIDATDLRWEGPFHGLVVANELVDVFPCEKLRVSVPGPEIHRVHVMPIAERRWARKYNVPDEDFLTPPANDNGSAARYGVLSQDRFWQLVEAGDWGESDDSHTLGEVTVPVAEGWLDDDGSRRDVPVELLDWLDDVRPMLSDLEACELLPADVYWSPSTSRLVDGLSRLLDGTGERMGAALLLDYGGTARHIIDPRSRDSHFRVYGGLRSDDHKPLPYLHPAARDLTWDVDFTELALRADQAGLEVRFFGHQSALELSSLDLASRDAVEALIPTVLGEGEIDIRSAIEEAARAVQVFRSSPGFRCLVLGHLGFELEFDDFGTHDDVLDDGLRALAPDVSAAELRAELATIGLGEAAKCLKACGDPVADLEDHGHYPSRRAILELLDARGWLCAPGEASRRLPANEAPSG